MINNINISKKSYRDSNNNVALEGELFTTPSDVGS